MDIFHDSPLFAGIRQMLGAFAKQQMRTFAESLPRPFHVRYNDQYNTVEVDSNVKLLPHSPPKTKQAPLVPPHSHGDA